MQFIEGEAKCRDSKWNSLLGASCGGKAVQPEKTEFCRPLNSKLKNLCYVVVLVC